MRKRLFEIIEIAEGKDITSKVYDIFMLIIIFINLIPIMLKKQTQTSITVDYICAYIFIIDYALRWITADLKNNKSAFATYPITPMAILDLLAILPTFGLISRAFRVMKIARVFKALRIFKALRYSKNFVMIVNVIKKNVQVLLSLLVCAVFYVFVSALLIFSIEPDSFDSFFESLYWATTALTTVGYGDIYPVSDAGRLISMISSFFGIALVALPSGVITAGFISELDKGK